MRRQGAPNASQVREDSPPTRLLCPPRLLLVRTQTSKHCRPPSPGQSPFALGCLHPSSSAVISAWCCTTARSAFLLSVHLLSASLALLPNLMTSTKKAGVEDREDRAWRAEARKGRNTLGSYLTLLGRGACKVLTDPLDTTLASSAVRDS